MYVYFRQAFLEKLLLLQRNEEDEKGKGKGATLSYYVLMNLSLSASLLPTGCMGEWLTVERELSWLINRDRTNFPRIITMLAWNKARTRLRTSKEIHFDSLRTGKRPQNKGKDRKRVYPRLILSFHMMVPFKIMPFFGSKFAEKLYRFPDSRSNFRKSSVPSFFISLFDNFLWQRLNESCPPWRRGDTDGSSSSSSQLSVAFWAWVQEQKTRTTVLAKKMAFCLRHDKRMKFRVFSFEHMFEKEAI